jgi:hypothetical protein
VNPARTCGPPGVGDLGVPDAAEHPDVAESAARLLEVAVEKEGQLPLLAPPVRGQLAQHGQVMAGELPPLHKRRLAQSQRQLRVTSEVADVEKAERRLGVLVGDLERFVVGAHGMVEREAGVPDRVPDPFRDRRNVGGAGMQQDEIEVTVRGALAAAETTEREQRDSRRRVGLFEQVGQPHVERRRPLLAGGGANSARIPRSPGNGRGPGRRRRYVAARLAPDRGHVIRGPKGRPGHVRRYGPSRPRRWW